jgi:hypothetical protein
VAGGTNCKSPELDNIFPQNPRCIRLEAAERACKAGSDKKSLFRYKYFNAANNPKGGITSADSGVSSRFKLSRYLRCSKADIDNILSAFTSARANPAIK